MKLPIYAIVISLFLSLSLFTFLASVLLFGSGFFFFTMFKCLFQKKGKKEKKDKKKSVFLSFS